MLHPALKAFLQGKITLTAQQESIAGSFFLFRSIKKNEILLPKGKVATHIFFVISGCLRIYLSDDESLNEFTRFLIFEGSFGTAFPSFILQQPSVAAIQSLETSEVLMLGYEDRKRLYAEIPGWESMDRKGLELDYIASILRIESLISMDAATRYQMLLKRNPKMVLRLPSRIIADYLGISTETLSRLKSKSRNY